MGHQQPESESGGLSQAMELSERFLTHALTPSNVGMIVGAEGQSNPSTDCGDNIELYLSIKDNLIADAKFLTEGCMHTIACGSALCTLVKGSEVAVAAKLDEQAIADELGGLDEGHWHTATLAKQALTAALADYFATRDQPWKKLYQK